MPSLAISTQLILETRELLQAILYHLRCFEPQAEITCICTGPEATAATHQIEAIPITEAFVRSRSPSGPLARVARRVFIKIPNELYACVKGVITLSRTHMLIIPGTGLLTDAFGLRGWGPYNSFKWSLIAKMCGCKLFFVSVGAGPIYSRLGRVFVKSALSLADVRSYRDNSTKQYLKSIGFRADNDPVYPDLVFSLSDPAITQQPAKQNGRCVVGLGLMTYAQKYSNANPSIEIQKDYLENMAQFIRWLLAGENDVRLLIGELGDASTKQEIRGLLDKFPKCDDRRIIDEPIFSVESLLSQIAATDIVVATRFHNVILSLLCNKPVIAISFHHKCESLMQSMGLSDYCLDINTLKSDLLIEIFRDLQKNADKLKPLIREKVEAFREELNEQYNSIFDMNIVHLRNSTIRRSANKNILA